MRPPEEVQRRIETAGRAVAQALGDGLLCLAVYGSAAGEEFSPGHSDVNLLVVLRRVAFGDLRLIGETLRREASSDLAFATPLVVTPGFLRTARDTFPIELADIQRRHRVLAGDDLLRDLAVASERLREQAEREARTRLLHVRALALHRPPDAEVRRALASLVPGFALIERALTLGRGPAAPAGAGLFAEVGRRSGVSLRTLARLARMREGDEAWPEGGDLDDLLVSVLAEVEALVAFVDGYAA